MTRALLAILAVLCSAPSLAATWYVRTDGGTLAQCTGQADAAYPGSGTNQACAVSHPFWLLPPSGTVALQGGDTLIVGPGQYQIGLGAPNTSSCSSSWPYDCLMATVPAGPSSANKTKIYGKGWDTGCSAKPQLWGNERVWQVMAVGSNVDVQCLEITDHSACIESGPLDGTVGGFPVRCERSTPPFGPWASFGLKINDGSANITLKNLDIHGLANGGLVALRVGDIDLDYVNLIANGWRGWEADGGLSDNSYTGTITFAHGKIEWNGCGEKYPLTTSNLSSSTDKHHCWEQQQGGYGDGIGMGNGSPGNWTITDSSVSWNTSDGVDLLHGTGNSTIKFIRSKAEGNNGNQFKSTGNAYIENSILVGDCSFFVGQPFTSMKDISGNTVEMNYCRASGQTMSLVAPLSSNRIYVSNSTIIGNGDTLWLLSGSGCSGTTKYLTLRNNIFYGGDDWHYNFTQNPDREQVGFSYIEANCTSSNVDEDYNIVYLTKDNNAGCVGAHSKCGVDPLFAGTIKQGPLGNYYTGTDYASQLTLQATSPAIGAANTAITLTGTSNDYLNAARGAQWDMGGYEYVSGGTTYTVTPSAGSNGSISPNTAQTVNSGSTTAFSVTANAGYTATVGGTCGGSPSTGTGTFSYTTSAVSANCTVAATFASTPTTYTVTGTAGSGGSISPASQTVNGGATATLTVTPNAGYTASASGCGGSLAGTTYTTGAISANCAVSASFCKKLSVPASLVATGLTPNPPSNATLSFDWSDVTTHADGSALTGDLANYRTYFGTVSGGPYNTASSASSQISVGPTNANVTYYARVAAESSVNSICNSDQTAEISLFADTVPPVLSGLNPSGNYPKTAANVALGVTTNEAATCRHGSAGSAWSSKTAFSTTGATSHSATLAVWAGLVKRICYQCRDAMLNESAESCTTFSVSAKQKAGGFN